MKIKLPLYGKILLWFFLNLVLLVTAFFIIARVQFKFGLDSLISGPAGERVRAIAHLLGEELRDAPRSDWNATLKHFSDAYQVQFFLFREDGVQIAGETVELPAEVRIQALDRRRPSPPQPLDPEQGPPGQPPDGPPGRRNEGPPRTMVHSAAPSRYWIIVPMMVPGPGRPMPAILLASSPSLSAGGLFFDYTPWIISGIAAILFSALFWFPLIRGITRDVSQMNRATEKIAEGRFDVRVRTRRNDELGALSESINQMAARLAGFVTGQKRFLGDIAHELCSPIARIQVALGILEQRADEKQMAYLADLREEVEQMSGLVNELLSFSKASIGGTAIKLQSVSARAVVDKAVARECSAHPDAQIKIDVADDLCALAEPELLLRAFGNILRNAIRYAGGTGPISIRAAREDGQVVFHFDDCGPGIPHESIPRIFDPFYRVDASRDRETGGTGLGLSIVKTCVESCGGSVACENRQPAGLRVSVKLSVAE
jgi:two-component system sensor histidine kinase CpxA